MSIDFMNLMDGQPAHSPIVGWEYGEEFYTVAAFAYVLSMEGHIDAEAKGQIEAGHPGEVTVPFGVWQEAAPVEESDLEERELSVKDFVALSDPRFGRRKFLLELDLNNEAFGESLEDAYGEAARLLSVAAKKLSFAMPEFDLRDINGNKVGTAHLYAEEK